MKRRGKTLGRDVKVYGNTEIKHAIGEIGYNPIQLNITKYIIAKNKMKENHME